MRFVLLAIAVCFSACGEPAHVITVDPDAGVDAPRDACAFVPSDAAPGCCALMPDLAAVADCARPVRPGICVDLFCALPDCSLVEVPVCGIAGDAGVDGGP